MMRMSLTMVVQCRPPSSTENVTRSMIGGNIRANELLAKAPIRAINRSKCGITRAIIPEIYKYQTNRKLSVIQLLGIKDLSNTDMRKNFVIQTSWNLFGTYNKVYSLDLAYKIDFPRVFFSIVPQKLGNQVIYWSRISGFIKEVNSCMWY